MKTSEKNPYHNYFKDHYDASFSAVDVEREKKWFACQWRYINSKYKIRPQKKILEIGSGLGGIYKFLEDKSIYLGIERDPAAVEFTNRFFKTNRFLNYSLESFYTPKKFDLVFAIEVLEHFDDPKTNIKKIHRLLSPEGVFIGTSPYPFRKNVFADKTHNFVLHPENWRRLFLEAGFKKVELYPMSFVPYFWRLNQRWNLVIPFYLPFKNLIATCLIIARK